MASSVSSLLLWRTIFVYAPQSSKSVADHSPWLLVVSLFVRSLTTPRSARALIVTRSFSTK